VADGVEAPLLLTSANAPCSAQASIPLNGSNNPVGRVLLLRSQRYLLRTLSPVGEPRISRPRLFYRFWFTPNLVRYLLLNASGINSWLRTKWLHTIPIPRAIFPLLRAPPSISASLAERD